MTAASRQTSERGALDHLTRDPAVRERAEPRYAVLINRSAKEKLIVKKCVPIVTAIMPINRAIFILTFALIFHARVSAAAPQTGERVYTTAADSTFVLEMSDAAGKVVGTATGFLVADNLVLTNAHVANAGAIVVRMGSLQVPCVTKRVDQLNDLALCEMAAKSSSTPIKFAAADPSPGATVYALGNPQGLEKTISQGLFTGVREVDGRRVAQISAAISPGSSGGPVLNSEAELVGVAVSYLKNGQALNFAVPLATVRDFVAAKARSASDHSSQVALAKGLITQRDTLVYADPKWQELNTQIADVLIQVVNGTSDLAVLDQVREIATWPLSARTRRSRYALRRSLAPYSACDARRRAGAARPRRVVVR